MGWQMVASGLAAVWARFKGPLERVIAEALARHGDEITDELTHSGAASRSDEEPSSPAEPVAGGSVGAPMGR